MSVISEKYIEDCFRNIQQELFLVVSPERWVITPKTYRLTSAKTKYGMADFKGVIHINRLFLDTDYCELLQAVLRHEFAHLCVGLKQGHNHRFKACEQLFATNFKGKSKLQAKLYGKRVIYQYRLLAVLSDGEEVMIKQVHRRHSKYTKYHKQSYIRYYFQKRKIEYFKYVKIC